MSDTPVQQPQTAAARYAHLEQLRQPYLDRARQCARVTLPYVMPPDGWTGSDDLPTPYQSVGAEGVQNLASKLLLTLFPPGASCFKLGMDQFLEEQLTGSAQGTEGDPKGAFQAAFAKIERAVGDRLEQKASRASFFEAFIHQIVCGNVLLEEFEGGRFRCHHLDKYVVKRDPMGTPLEIIVKQPLARVSLPPAVLAIVMLREQQMTDDEKAQSAQETVDLYTRIVRRERVWHVYQEVQDVVIEEARGTYPLDACPWMPQRFFRVSGEDYGRGLVEAYLGDHVSLETLEQSCVELTAAIAKILFLVKTGSITDKADIARAPSGAVVDGDVNDVGVLAFDKARDLSVAEAKCSRIEQRLQRVYLLLSGVQRDAERVTAEEIRTMAQELESALGGVYSLLAEEMQLPIVRRLMLVMQREGRLPALPKGAVNPQIVTGLAALGRGSDFQRLKLFVQDIEQTFGVENVVKYVNPVVYMNRLATALNMDTAGLVRTPEEVQQIEQQSAMQEMAKTALPKAMDASMMQQQGGAPEAPPAAA